MLKALSILIGVVALILVLYWEYKDPWTPRGKETPTWPAYCAWCIYRDGEDCTNPRSPVYRQSCGPVCSGALRCKVREVKQS